MHLFWFSPWDEAYISIAEGPDFQNDAAQRKSDYNWANFLAPLDESLSFQNSPPPQFRKNYQLFQIFQSIIFNIQLKTFAVTAIASQLSGKEI